MRAGARAQAERPRSAAATNSPPAVVPGPRSRHAAVRPVRPQRTRLALVAAAVAVVLAAVLAIVGLAAGTRAAAADQAGELSHTSVSVE